MKILHSDTPFDIKFELIALLVGLIVSILIPVIFNVDSKIGWFAALLSILLSFYSISIKVFLHKFLSETKKETYDKIGATSTLIHKVVHMPKQYLPYAKDILEQTLHQISKVECGVIPLTEEQYFHKIIDETKSLRAGDNMFCINVFDPRRFVEDPREIAYFKENINAILKYKIEIERIFVIDIDTLKSDKGTDRINVIRESIKNGIKVKCVDIKKILSANRNELLIDWVLFNGNEQRLYIDYQDKLDMTRVANGELVLNNSIEKFEEKFEILTEYAMLDTEMNKLLQITPKRC